MSNTTDTSLTLPIYQHQQQFLEMYAQHRLIIVEGPTGSGKSTQLPRMLYHAQQIKKCLAITQPRRMAAVSLAHRVAEEEQSILGESVGYTIRFEDRSSNQSRIKFMTDGILLQQARSDPLLRMYDCIMVDEAHERSLNIDFVLGLLKKLLNERDDLKIIIASATLSTALFKNFFYQKHLKNIPILSIKSRQYAVDIHYRPITTQKNKPSTKPNHSQSDTLLQAMADGVNDLLHKTQQGHFLVFLPGEGSIKQLAKLLEVLEHKGLCKIISLYGKLGQAEQSQAFEEHWLGQRCLRKVILATNIAETSITIDGICFVLDSGLCKLPWYQAKTGIVSLRELPISQASATQRAGRAGRTGPGEVIRFYSEELLKESPLQTPEEILRVDLSEVVLKLLDLNIHDIEAFDFPTPPPSHLLQAALAKLQHLGAVTKQRTLTRVGRKMVYFPVSAQLSRMIIEAADHFPHALQQILLVAAYLSMKRPFLLPSEQEEEAKAAHKRFHHPYGDLCMGLSLYHAFSRSLDKSAFCQNNFLDEDSMFFMTQAYQQLQSICQEQQLLIEQYPAQLDMDAIVRCLMVSFSQWILCKKNYYYENDSGMKIYLHPSSCLYNRQLPYVIATEIFESGRTYAVCLSPLTRSQLKSFLGKRSRIYLKKSIQPSATYKTKQPRKKSVKTPRSAKKRSMRRR